MERSPQLPEDVIPEPPVDQSPVPLVDVDHSEQVNQGAVVERLGEIATTPNIVNGLAHEANDNTDLDHDNEPDTYPWDDAAHWNPEQAADSQLIERHCTRAELDQLFDELPDEEVGSDDELPWYGLLGHRGRPGGFLLREDSLGFRTVHEAETDEVLNLAWSNLQREHEQLYAEREAYERVTEGADRAEFTGPRIWVGSVADYVAGRLYGVWMDATSEPEELEAAAWFMLRGSRVTGTEVEAEEWGIFDHEGFHGYHVEEYLPLATVSRIASGISEHGEAYAAWVNYVGVGDGNRNENLLSDESFQDHYLGQFDSMEVYVENLLEECGDYEYLDQLPEHLKPYVKIDIEMMARDLGSELYVVDAAGCGVLVFDPRS